MVKRRSRQRPMHLLIAPASFRIRQISKRALNSPLKKPIRATAGSRSRFTALRSLAESPESTRSRLSACTAQAGALSSVTIARPRLQSDFINGLLT